MAATALAGLDAGCSRSGNLTTNRAPSPWAGPAPTPGGAENRETIAGQNDPGNSEARESDAGRSAAADSGPRESDGGPEGDTENSYA